MLVARSRNRSLNSPLVILLVACAFLQALHRPAAAAEPARALDSVLEIAARVPTNARTAEALGTDRTGTGIMIDDTGLILTIGYLILEASEIQVEGAEGEPVPAEIVAYDHESGFGLIRAQGVQAPPVELGNSDAIRPRQPLLAVSRVGSLDAQGVYAVDRRTFAGYWEYLLEDAIFTSPPLANFGGAALLDEDGRLVGIGSLIVQDAVPGSRPLPGNMFVPVDQLKPILGDLLADGRRNNPPRPWLGASFEEHRGRVFVIRVSPGSPAADAGLVPNDLVLGIAGQRVVGLEDFYRRLWQQGDAGVEVELDLLKELDVIPTVVRSGDRYRWLKLDPSF